MSKHTPGPWAYQTGSFNVGRFVSDSIGQPVCIISGNSNPEGMKRERNGTHEANARLIAAAPELLEACHKAVELIAAEYCSHQSATGPCSHLNERCYAQEILAAIAKAEGKE